jgi:hypothetical protein
VAAPTPSPRPQRLSSGPPDHGDSKQDVLLANSRLTRCLGIGPWTAAGRAASRPTARDHSPVRAGRPPRPRGRRSRTSWGSASRLCAGSTSIHLRVFCTTLTASPFEYLVFPAVRAPPTSPTFAFVGRQSHGVATPRALPPGRGFKERLFAARGVGAHHSSHCSAPFLCVCVCVSRP